MLIDTHCHLAAAEFRPIATRWGGGAGGRGAIVVPAVDAASFAEVRACCTRHHSVRRLTAFIRFTCSTPGRAI
jgi:hypothetical protein